MSTDRNIESDFGDAYATVMSLFELMANAGDWENIEPEAMQRVGRAGVHAAHGMQDSFDVLLKQSFKDHQLTS